MPLTATPGGECRERSPGTQGGDGVCRSITGQTLTPGQTTTASKWRNRKRLTCSLRAMTSVFNKSRVIIIYHLQSKSWSWKLEMTQALLRWLSSINQSASPQAGRSSTFLTKMNLYKRRERTERSGAEQSGVTEVSPHRCISAAINKERQLTAVPNTMTAGTYLHRRCHTWRKGAGKSWW